VDAVAFVPFVVCMAMMGVMMMGAGRHGRGDR